MNIKNLSLTLLLLFLWQGAWGNEKPNIIVIVADDLGWNDVGFHGGDIDTPSLDRLAREGARFDRFYTAPICSPTRAALMTGRDPIRLGLAYSVILPWDNNGVHPDEHFMPQSFKAAGYQTAMVGKWHLGHAQQTYHPNERGFDHFYGHLHTEVGFYPPFANSGGKDFQRNGVSINDDGYETFLLSQEVTRYIKQRDASKPFFIYMPFLAPHTPLDAPQELQDKYKDINTDLAPARSAQTDNTRKMAKLTMQKSARPMYAAVVDGMDQAIGQVLQTLDDEGITDNTLVFFMSDNGGAAYSVGGADNSPLRGGKGETFEGGIRVVATARWPGKIKANTDVKQMMTVMDVFPTLAEAAGIETRNKRTLDGASYWSSITDGVHRPREEFVTFISEIPLYGHFNIATLNEEWKLVQEIDQEQTSIEIKNYLFNLKDDPNEYHDLSAQHPDMVKELADKIIQWRALHPINGVRSKLAPPPGWRAPLDWATYPIPIDKLQSTPARNMAPSKVIERILDRQHGTKGRLVYDCEPQWWSQGVCIKNSDEE